MYKSQAYRSQWPATRTNQLFKNLDEYAFSALKPLIPVTPRCFQKETISIRIFLDLELHSQVMYLFTIIRAFSNLTHQKHD